MILFYIQNIIHVYLHITFFGTEGEPMHSLPLAVHSSTVTSSNFIGRYTVILIYIYLSITTISVINIFTTIFTLLFSK